MSLTIQIQQSSKRPKWGSTKLTEHEMRTVSQAHNLFFWVNHFLYVVQCSSTSSSWNAVRSADAGLLGRATRQPVRARCRAARPLTESTDILITNSRGRANSLSAYRQHWHFNRRQLRTSWKTTMEFVLTHHHRLTSFNMLCNCPVTTQESHIWGLNFIHFCAVKETENKQTSPAVTSP